MKIRNRFFITTKYWFIILVIVCVCLMGLSFVSDNTKNPFHAVASVTVVPMQKGLNKVGQWFADLTQNFATLEEMQEENQRLQEQVDALTIENNELIQDQYELERLQALYKLDQDYGDYEKIGANVIANSGSNWFYSFTVDKGSKDGIEEGMNVMAGSGLVGIVTEVSYNWSTVRSIIDDASNVSAMVLTTGDTCIVEGDLTLMNDGKLRFYQLINNDREVTAGDQIVTSAISSEYVQGILIGYISEVQVDTNNMTRSGYLTPAVDFTQLQEVLIITTTKQEMVEQ